jgi:hypothetical protein
MNAKEARQNTIDNIKDWSEYRIIIEEIKNATNRGEFSIEVDWRPRCIETKVKYVLYTEDGYKVETDNNITTLSW